MIFIIIIATTLKNGKNEKIDKYLEKQQEKYLIDFKNNKPVFAKTPILFSETEIYNFPFIKYFCPFKQLKIIFEKIKTTKIDIKYDLYELDEIDNFKATSGWITFAKNYDGYYFITLIDYFQEDCRMLCQRVNAKTNFITFFDQNKKK